MGLASPEISRQSERRPPPPAPEAAPGARETTADAHAAEMLRAAAAELATVTEAPVPEKVDEVEVRELTAVRSKAREAYDKFASRVAEWKDRVDGKLEITLLAQRVEQAAKKGNLKELEKVFTPAAARVEAYLNRFAETPNGKKTAEAVEKRWLTAEKHVAITLNQAKKKFSEAVGNDFDGAVRLYQEFLTFGHFITYRQEEYNYHEKGRVRDAGYGGGNLYFITLGEMRSAINTAAYERARAEHPDEQYPYARVRELLRGKAIGAFLTYTTGQLSNSEYFKQYAVDELTEDFNEAAEGNDVAALMAIPLRPVKLDRLTPQAKDRVIEAKTKIYSSDIFSKWEFFEEAVRKLPKKVLNELIKVSLTKKDAAVFNGILHLLENGALPSAALKGKDLMRNATRVFTNSNWHENRPLLKILAERLDAEDLEKLYIDTVEGGYHDYKILQGYAEIFGQRMAPETVQKCYATALKNGYGRMALEVRSASGVEPALPAAAIQEGYRVAAKRTIKENRMYVQDFTAIHELTGAAPELPEDQFRELCDIWVGEGNLDSFMKLLVITKKQLDDEFFKTHYVKLIANGNTRLLKKFQDLPLEKPALTDAVAQEGYYQFFKGDTSARTFKDLHEGLGFVEHPETVQRAYRASLPENKIDTIERIFEMTSLKPEFTAPEVQKSYAELVTKGNIVYALKLRKVMDIEPEVSDDVAQKGFAAWLTAPNASVSESTFETIAAIQEFTGRRIGAPLVHEGYMRLIAMKYKDGIAELERVSQIPPDWDRIGKSMALGDIRFLVSLDIPELKRSCPWYESLEQLRDVQDFADNEEHDPWRTELQPLLDATIEQKILAPDLQEDSALFLSFIKEFGALNMPKLLALYVELKRNPDPKRIRPEYRKMLTEALGETRVSKFQNSEAAINEIRRFKSGFQSELLRDAVPDRITTALGVEILNAVRTKTKWARETTPAVILELWEKTRKDPEKARIPEGYAEETVSVPLAQRETKAESVSREAQEQKIMQNIDLVKSWETLHAIGVEALRTPEMGAWWERAREGLFAGIEERRARAQAKLAGAPERARAGLEKNITAFNAAAEELRKIEFPESGSSEAEYVAFMERLVAVKTAYKLDDIDRILQIVSMRHLSMVLPEGMAGDLNIFDPDRQFTTEVVAKTQTLLRDFVKEHYLHPEQQRHWTNHTSMSAELRGALETIWQLKDAKLKEGANPLFKAGTALEALKKGGTGVGTEPVTFVPVRGLLRVFSGDVGDACYTSRHEELARGGHPGLTGIMMVTGRSSPQERLAGSVLFVETKTPGGDGVLHVRANNPRMNLLGKVDSDAFVGEILKYAVRIAEKRGLKYVDVPLSGGSTSNRPAVSQYYSSRYSNRPRLSLISEPQTNFNGYDNWNSRGGNAVVVVWERGGSLNLDTNV